MHLNKADSRLAPIQRETLLQCNAISHWLGANLESALFEQMSDRRYDYLLNNRSHSDPQTKFLQENNAVLFQYILTNIFYNFTYIVYTLPMACTVDEIRVSSEHHPVVWMLGAVLCVLSCKSSLVHFLHCKDGQMQFIRKPTRCWWHQIASSKRRHTMSPIGIIICSGALPKPNVHQKWRVKHNWTNKGGFEVAA